MESTIEVRPDPLGEKPYRIEIRVDASAKSNEDAEKLAAELASQIGGEVTAIFDENWEEV